MGVSMNDIMFQIHDKIKSNPDILKLLYYTDNTKNPLTQTSLTRTQAQQVAENYIYTRKKIPSESEGIRCYISMRYGQKIYHHEKNQYFNGNTFTFYILCHNEFDTNKIIGSRVCEIERLICKLFDEGDIGTTCKTMVTNSIDVDINGTDYSGRQVTIAFVDNNDHMVNKAVKW